MDNIYITVKSSDSMDFFTNNAWHNFRVKLSKPLILTGRWEVALIEMYLSGVGLTNKTLLNVCSSRTVGSIVEGRESNVLRSVFINQKKFQHVEFNVPIYVMTDTGYIENIDIVINRADGEDINSVTDTTAEGLTVCLLHFRKNKK